MTADPNGAHRHLRHRPAGTHPQRRDFESGDPPSPARIRVHAVDRSDRAIRVDALVRSFGVLRAVDELTLEVPTGIIFGFLGPNGAGKTTTINLLLGLLEPTSGRAEVLGFDPWTRGEEVRGRTGAVLEHTGVYEQLSAEENLEFYGRVWRIPTDARRARIHELLTAMDLWDRRREKAGTWSRGMQQRLALARALLHRPSLLFLDEPTAGLDVMAATSVRDDLASTGQDDWDDDLPDDPQHGRGRAAVLGRRRHPVRAPAWRSGARTSCEPEPGPRGLRSSAAVSTTRMLASSVPCPR